MPAFLFAQKDGEIMKFADIHLKPVPTEDELTQKADNDEISHWKYEKRECITNLNTSLDANNHISKNASINDALNTAQNYLNNHKMVKANADLIKSYMGMLRAIQSNYENDMQVPELLNNHIMNQEKSTLYDRIVSNINEYDKTQQTTPQAININLLYGSPEKYQNEQELLHNLQWELDNESHVSSFDNQFGHMKPGYQKFITSTGQTFYFPHKWLNVEGTSDYLDSRVVFDPIEWINRRNSYDTKYKREQRLSNNMYRQLQGLEVNHHWFQFNNNDKFMRDANTAMGKYQYQTVHDEIWEQYHRDQIQNDRNALKGVSKKSDRIRKKIKKLQNKINYYYYRTRSKKWEKLGRQRDRLKRKLNQFEGSRLSDIKGNQRKINWWINRINQRNGKFSNYRSEQIARANYIGTNYNVTHDQRYKHFGYIRPRNPDTDHSYIYFMVTDESPAYETQIASTPVEWGVNITTGTQKQQTQVSINGILFNPKFSTMANQTESDTQYANNNDNSTDTINGANNENKTRAIYWNVINQAKTLANWNKQGTEMFYSGQDWYRHCLISEFQPDYNNSGDDGSITSINFTMTLTLCDYFDSNINVKKRSTHRVAARPGKGKKSRTNKNRHKYIRVKAGMTYGLVGHEKHISVSKLRKMNPWPDRRIPTGVEMRIQ